MHRNVFSGTYGHSLEKSTLRELFGLLNDEKYCRALNIDTYEA